MLGDQMARKLNGLNLATFAVSQGYQWLTFLFDRSLPIMLGLAHVRCSKYPFLLYKQLKPALRSFLKRWSGLIAVVFVLCVFPVEVVGAVSACSSQDAPSLFDRVHFDCRDGGRGVLCDIRQDQWGGGYFRMGVWGADERRPLEVDESSSPKELRLTTEEKRKLAAVGPIMCEDQKGNAGRGTGFIITSVDAIDSHNPISHSYCGQQGYRERKKNGTFFTPCDHWGGRFFKAGVWGPDDRKPLDGHEDSIARALNLTNEEKKQLRAVGAILCTDSEFINTDGTGFIVDIEEVGGKSARNYEIIATASHVLYNGSTGEKRRCEFYPNSANLKEYYDISPVVCGTVETDYITNKIIDKDWCFAKIEKKISDNYGKLEIDFSDKFDWTMEDTKHYQYISGGWRPDVQRVEFASNCAPDDKREYPTIKQVEARMGHDYSRVVIGNCDEDPGTSGGAFMQRENNKLKAFAIILGDLDQRDRGEYNPNEGRGNLYTKFTTEMREELLKMISSLDTD